MRGTISTTTSGAAGSDLALSAQEAVVAEPEVLLPGISGSEHEKSTMRRGRSDFYSMVFYARYPNKASKHDNPLRRGYFDDLKHYVGLGVDPSKKKVLYCSGTAGDTTTIFV